MNRFMLPLLAAVLCVALCLAGCDRDSAVSRELDRAESLMEAHPDSALALLDTISPSRLTTDRSRALYALLLSQALIKNGKVVENDSLLIKSVHYFDGLNDSLNLIKSLFYLGKVKFYSNDFNSAIKYATNSYELSIASNEDLWKARSSELIADINSFSNNYDESIKFSNKAVDYYKKANKISNHRYAICDLGTAYSNNGKADIGIQLIDSISNIAISNNDSSLTAYCFRSLIPVYLFNKQINKASNVISRISEYKKFYTPSFMEFLYITQVDIENGNYDNIHYLLTGNLNYSELSIGERAMLYSLFSEYYKKKDNYKEAQRYNDSIITLQNDAVKNTMKQSVIVSQRDYYDSISKEEQEKSSEYRTKFIILSAIAILIIIIFITYFIFQREKTKNIYLELEKAQNKADDLKNSLWEKNIENNYNVSEARKKIQDLFFHHFELIDSFSTFYDVNEKKPQNSIILYRKLNNLLSQFCDPESLTAIEDICNKYQNNIMSQFRNLFPDLPSSQYKLALYIFLGFSTSTIATFLNTSKTNIHVYKSRLKKIILESNSEVPNEIKRYFL